MILQRVRQVEDQARLVRGQDVDRHAPRLVAAIDHTNLQVRRAQAREEYVLVADEDTPLETLRAVRPHVLAKGQDYNREGVVVRRVSGGSKR